MPFGARGRLPNPELPTFKRLNPDWLSNLRWWTALNFEKPPRSRALKLRVIEEFFDCWDFDGIELDWLRHTLNFPRGTERENAKHLTSFMRSVRRSLQERGRAAAVDPLSWAYGFRSAWSGVWKEVTTSPPGFPRIWWIF